MESNHVCPVSGRVSIRPMTTAAAHPVYPIARWGSMGRARSACPRRAVINFDIKCFAAMVAFMFGQIFVVEESAVMRLLALAIGAFRRVSIECVCHHPSPFVKWSPCSIAAAKLHSLHAMGDLQSQSSRPSARNQATTRAHSSSRTACTAAKIAARVPGMV